MTSTLVGVGHVPRYVVGSVNLTEFFVTIATSATFIVTLGLGDLAPVIPLVIGGLISAPFAGYLVKIAPAVDGDGRKPDPALERADVPEDGRVALTHRCPWTRRLIFPPRCRHDCRERRGSSEILAIAGAVLTSAGRDSDLVVFTSGIGGGIKDLAPAKEFINLLMSSAALPPCYLVRCLYLGTSRTSADLRLESAKWAKADLIRSLSPIAI